MFNLGLYGSHNTAFAIAENDTVLEVVELERLVNKKNAALFYYYTVKNPQDTIQFVKQYFENKYGVKRYANVMYNSFGGDYPNIPASYTAFEADNYEYVPHHTAHAASSLYQSPYDEALIISFDGGSDEGFFNVFIGNKKTGIQKIYSGTRDYAVPYMVFGHHAADIKREEIFMGNLVYAGKLMGLAGYGNVRPEWIAAITDFYNNGDRGDVLKTADSFLNHFKKFGINETTSRWSGQMANDMAATNQYVFEMLFLEEAAPFLNEYKHLPVIITGGCGLNILLNTRLAQNREVFVSPNPNDCGIALGTLLHKIKPEVPVDITYAGSPAWDGMQLMEYVEERKATALDISTLAQYIVEGNIVGVVRGGAEHGPRALGNRSILCNPAIPNMKDTLNAKVKGREYYRPFAPVVRLEDVNKYFEWDKESRWMSFCPKVRDMYKEKLQAITHVDGTARVQTVTREQNEFLYDLLTALDKLTGVGVILNTSFNIAGKPILNTYKDALWVLDNKQMDGLVLENYFIKKENRL
jgi:carbamoyltransferase